MSVNKRKVKLPEIMLFIVAAIVPIIVRLAAVPTPPELAELHPQLFREDLLSFHKAWVLCVAALAIVLHGLSELAVKWPDLGTIKHKALELACDPVIIIVFVYLLFVIISNIASPYTHTALWGIYDRREGLFVQLSYITVFLSAMFLVRAGTSPFVVLYGLLVSSLIMGAIGFSQFINSDFFATPLGGFLVAGVWAPAQPRFTMSYGTSFNPNTFGLITAMLFPIMFGAAGRSGAIQPVRTSDRLVRGLFIFAGALMVIGVVGSRSVGGFIGASTAILAVITTMAVRWLVQREKRAFDRRVFVALAVALALAAAAGFALRDYFYDNLSFTMGRIAAIFEPPDMSHLPEFTFEGNRLTMGEGGVVYHITFPVIAGSPEVTDAGGTPITPTVEQGQMEQDGAALTTHQYTFYIPGAGNRSVLRFGPHYVFQGILFEVYNGILHIVIPRGEWSLVDPNEPIPSWGFEGWETWGSNRGHIFARTIPLLPRSLIIGRGSDTFLLQFPTHDIISNLRYHGTPYMLVDKAHNLYLQTAVTTGVISALALAALFAYFIITAFFALVREKDPGDFWLRLGILASVSAFSVSSLSTDSTVSSTPMFWLIIGMGFALNGRRTG